MSVRRQVFASVLLGSAILCAAETAAAQPLGNHNELIRTHEYSVDLFQGPVLASSRVTGLAGAYVAIAEGVEGIGQNPASPAVRVPWSYDHFDYDLGLGVSFPTALSNGDFFNSGSADTTRSKDQQLLFFNVAANLQFGSWGFGLSLDLQGYGLDRSNTAPQTDELTGQFALAHLIVAKAFSSGQLILGAGLISTALSITNAADGENNEVFNTQGAGAEAGVLWRPNDEPFRVGAAVRSAVTTEPNKPAEILYPGTGDNELWLPNRVTLPWEVNLGFAVQLGARPFNPRWHDPSDLMARVRWAMSQRKAARERRRELLVARARALGHDLKAAQAAIDAELETQSALDELRLQADERRVDRALRDRVAQMARPYVLVSTSVVMTGPAENAVGIESFLERRVNRSGQSLIFSPRLGIESEVVPEWLKLRVGTYGEPTRFSHKDAHARLHGTMGFDLKVFPWTVFGLFHEGTEWRVGGSLDAAVRYLGWGVSIGVWH